MKGATATSPPEVTVEFIPAGNELVSLAALRGERPSQAVQAQPRAPGEKALGLEGPLEITVAGWERTGAKRQLMKPGLRQEEPWPPRDLGCDSEGDCLFQSSGRTGWGHEDGKIGVAVRSDLQLQ